MECEHEEEIEEVESNENKKIRKLFLDELPKRGKLIDWKSSINHIVNFIYDDIEGVIKIINYEPNGQHLFVKYLNKKIFKIHTSKFLTCRLGKLLDRYTVEFKINIKSMFKDNKRDLVITNNRYEKSKNSNQNFKYYKYTCNKCGWTEGWITEGNLLNGQGCSCCTNRIVVEGINDIPTTAPWMIPYFQGGIEESKLYTKSSGQSISPVCPDCGGIKKKKMHISTINNEKSIGCSCGDGIKYPNKFAFSLLEQLGTKFETEYSPKWCGYKLGNKIKQGRYDFYFELNNKKYIIEMDGGFHHKDNTMNKQTKEESELIDDYKDKLARDHGIQIIRIGCEESDLKYIKTNMLNSKLATLFDFNKIDWIKIESFALNNLVKKACRIKNDNLNITTTEIGEIMNLHSITIMRYLKKGNEIGWCVYVAREEMIKCNKKNAINNIEAQSKTVEIFKDGISLGIIKGCGKLERESERVFGTKLLQSKISSVCLGKQKSYKGFTFKYIEDTGLVSLELNTAI